METLEQNILQEIRSKGGRMRRERSSTNTKPHQQLDMNELSSHAAHGRWWAGVLTCAAQVCSFEGGMPLDVCVIAYAAGIEGTQLCAFFSCQIWSGVFVEQTWRQDITVVLGANGWFVGRHCMRPLTFNPELRNLPYCTVDWRQYSVKFSKQIWS